MGPLGVVELQGVGDAVDDAVGDAGGVAALQPGVDSLEMPARRATSSRRRPETRRRSPP
jgi:hypothetical protein